MCGAVCKRHECAVMLIASFLLCLGGCKGVSEVKRTTEEGYEQAYAHIMRLLTQELHRRLSEGFSHSDFSEPLSISFVNDIKELRFYRQVLSERLLRLCGIIEADDENSDFALVEFVHICDLMAATKDPFFIDILRAARHLTHYSNTMNATLRAEETLEKGWDVVPKCGFSASKERVLEVEGRPKYIIRYENLDEEGQRFYRERFRRSIVEMWIYYNKSRVSDEGFYYMYGWDSDGKISLIMERGDTPIKRLIKHLKKE